MINLSKYTEKLTDKEFLDVELEYGISLDNHLFMDLANNTIKQLNGYGSTLIDYGCGVGAYAKAAMDAGLQVEAFEKFKAHKEYLKYKIPDLKFIKKLKDVDIMLFIEVAEHMKDDEIVELFKSGKPKWILFSSTPHKSEWDNFWGHINIKQPLEWDDFFNSIGYRKHKDLILPTQWSKMYEKI